jgi:hypothetical protein
LKQLYVLLAICLFILSAQQAIAQFSPPIVVAEHKIAVPFTLALADLDGNGHLDAITYAQHLAIAYNEGNGTSFTKSYNTSTYLVGVYHITVADLNRDGHKDIVATIDVGNGFIKLVAWYGKNDTNNSSGYANRMFDPAVTLHPSLAQGNFEIVDVDADGAVDILLPAGTKGMATQHPTWLRNEGKIGDWPQNDLPALPVSNTLRLADLNGDGQHEALLLLSTGEFAVYAGATFGTKMNLLPEQIFATEAKPVIVDMDGDGDLDIVLLKDKGIGLVLFENKGDLQFTPHHIENYGNQYTSFAVGDLDNDGDMDIVAGCWTTCRITCFLNQGNGSFDHTLASSNSASINSFEELKLGDIDADGYLDIVLTDRKAKEIVWYRNLVNENVLHASPADALSGKALLFPNPSTGSFQVTLDEGSISEVLVYDALGRLVKEVRNPSRLPILTIDMQGRGRGLYQVQLRLQNGSMVHKKLLIN